MVGCQIDFEGKKGQSKNMPRFCGGGGGGGGLGWGVWVTTMARLQTTIWSISLFFWFEIEFN